MQFGVLAVIVCLAAGLGSLAQAVQPPSPIVKPLQSPQAPLRVTPVKPEVVLRQVPTVIGMSEAQARSTLERAGLSVGGVSRVANAAAAGTVFAQSVAPGTRHDPREPIGLQISLGSKPEIKVFRPPLINPELFKPGVITPVPSPEPPEPERPPRDDVQPPVLVVPQLRETTLQQARSRLELRRLKLGRVERRPSDAPAGVVIDQSPEAGTRLQRPIAVDVVVSTGPQLIVVPNVVGLQLGEARDRLRALSQGQIEEQWIASDRPRGLVLRQSPTAGSRIRPTPPPSFRLFVSVGPRRMVPNVIDRTLAEAQQIIRGADLRVGAVREAESDAPAGRVIDQRPRGGTDIAAGRVEAVDLLISRGPPTPAPRAVPNVVGSDESAAAAQIREAELSVGTIEREHTSEPAGIVVEQKPRGGTPVPRDERVSVDLRVSLGPAPPPVSRRMPNLVGEPLDAVPSLLAPLELSIARVRAQASVEPKGTVLAQTPAAGAPVRAGSQVDVGVSDGSLVRVPALVGRSREEAAELLRSVGLDAREATRETAQDHGDVLEQNPQAGATVARGSPVQVTIAVAPQQEPIVEVPDVIGAPITQARQRIEQAGFAVTTQEADSLAYEAGTVAAQSPAGGAQAARNSAVQLTVSLGLPPLPDLVGLPASQARGRLAQLGLTATVSEQQADDQPQDIVLAQSPAAGARLSRGAEVALVVAIGPPEIVPRFPPAVVIAGAAGGALLLAGAGAWIARRVRTSGKPEKPAAERGTINAQARLDPAGRATELDSTLDIAGPDVRFRIRLKHGETRLQQEDGGQP